MCVCVCVWGGGGGGVGGGISAWVGVEREVDFCDEETN